MTDQEIRSIDYGSRKLTFSLSFSARRSLAISVDPGGHLSVVAPYDRELADIDRLVLSKAQWITAKQLEYARYSPPSMSGRLYVSGSFHRYLGRRYRLRLVRGGKTFLALRNGVFECHTPDIDDAAAVHEAFQAWYKSRTKSVFAEQLEKAVNRFPAQSAVQPAAVSVRAMKRRWGSMTKGGRLMLNLTLIEYSKPQIEYVITHELAHRLVPDHSKKFWKTLERAMPDWRERKRCLEGGG